MWIIRATTAYVCVCFSVRSALLLRCHVSFVVGTTGKENGVAHPSVGAQLYQLYQLFTYYHHVHAPTRLLMIVQLPFVRLSSQILAM